MTFMSNTLEKELRDRYIANEIFLIGDIVEDIKTNDTLKIINRGSNYVTVTSDNGVHKKWLTEIRAEVKKVPVGEDFEILPSGQIKMFGYETHNFDAELSQFILEQFSEFEDLYSKHQIIKCLDIAINENNYDTAYSYLNKVDSFYSKQNIQKPFIVEAIKTDLERKRIVDILASVAGIKPAKTAYETVQNALQALKDKYQSRKQWEVLYPFFKLINDAGFAGILQRLPYDFNSTKEDYELDIVSMVMEENIDLLVEDLNFDDITETFNDAEYSDQMISEVLSIETRQLMARKIKQHTPLLALKRERALSRAATTDVLQQRANRLAEIMLKRRMFHKDPSELTRQEKERFEAGASKRRALVAKLSQRLIGKVRALQTQRLHHTNSPTAHTHDIATANIHNSAIGAS